MILSQVSETDWLSSVTGLAPLQLPVAPMLVVAPHPDDETLAAGGLIAAAAEQGLDVTIAAVTDGENAYLEPMGDARRLGEKRRLEQECALQRLGIPRSKIVRFGLPDSGLKSRIAGLAEWLAPLVSLETHVVAPWPGDFHPDHEACGNAAAQVAAKVGASVSFYFFWTWHRGTPDLLDGLNLRSFALTPAWWQAKQEALACHQSQLVREDGSPILPEDLLAPARRTFEVFAI